MIHVCYGLYDGNGRYSKFTGTSILSMFENTREKVTVHILHDNTLTEYNRDKFSYIAGQYNQHIKFYNVEKICAESIKKFKNIFSRLDGFKIFSIGMLFRLLIPQIFSNAIKKIIYLDADVIVNLDINEFWQVPLEDKVIAAVPEMQNGIETGETFTLCREGFVKAEDYFNSGVLVINLEKWRGSEYENFQAGINFVVENIKDMWIDQNIFNYCFSKKYLKLDRDFNCFVNKAREPERQDFRVNHRSFHYVGSSLQMDMSDPFNRLWFSYFKKTQWFNEDLIAHLNEEFIKMNDTLKNMTIQISALMSGKSRAFFTDKRNLEFLKKAFKVQEGEEIIPAVNQDSLNILKESIKKSAGTKVYFILISNYYYFVRADLMKVGFVEGRDFVNAIQFLSDAHGVKLDTYNFVKAL